jgi:hypothetical protein
LGAFPVYYPLWLDARFKGGRCHHLNVLARATVRALVRYLALKPGGFLHLEVPQRERLSELLLTCAGSQERLARQLREAAYVGVSGRLLRALENFDSRVPPAGERDAYAWLDLLNGARPADFEHVYALVDVASQSEEPIKVAARLRPLLDLTTPLASVGVHLKLFVSDCLREHLGDLHAFRVVTLLWNKETLREALRERMRQASHTGASAGRDSLWALCDPGAAEYDVDEHMVSAVATPRDLVRWGNRLLGIHVESEPAAARLTVESVERWLDELDGETGTGAEVSA